MKISELPKITPHSIPDVFGPGAYFLVNYQDEDYAATMTVGTEDVANLMRIGTTFYNLATPGFCYFDYSGEPEKFWRFSLGNFEEMSSDEDWGYGHEYCLPIFVDVKDGKTEVYFNDPGLETRNLVYWSTPYDYKSVAYGADGSMITSDKCLPVCYVPGESKLFYYDLYDRTHKRLSGINVNTEGTVK